MLNKFLLFLRPFLFLLPLDHFNGLRLDLLLRDFFDLPSETILGDGVFFFFWLFENSSETVFSALLFLFLLLLRFLWNWNRNELLDLRYLSYLSLLILDVEKISIFNHFRNYVCVSEPDRLLETRIAEEIDARLVDT